LIKDRVASGFTASRLSDNEPNTAVGSELDDVSFVRFGFASRNPARIPD
jgi:hypothetical protein